MPRAATRSSAALRAIAPRSSSRRAASGNSSTSDRLPRSGIVRAQPNQIPLSGRRWTRHTAPYSRAVGGMRCGAVRCGVRSAECAVGIETSDRCAFRCLLHDACCPLHVARHLPLPLPAARTSYGAAAAATCHIPCDLAGRSPSDRYKQTNKQTNASTAGNPRQVRGRRHFPRPRGRRRGRTERWSACPPWPRAPGGLRDVPSAPRCLR